VEAKRELFAAVGFDPRLAFVPRPTAAAYLDFVAGLTERAAIRPLVENDSGVQACTQALRDVLAVWWTARTPYLADLPTRRNLNAVRREFLDSFVAALLPLGALDRFKLAGVIASWWTDTLPDFKTLIENGFSGVIDGWVDAVADALEDDEAAGPAFDPFGHKLVLRMMADYLERIAAAKADIVRLKGEKEAFEQSNAPDDIDEEELANWNYAKDLERQMRELKSENRDTIKALAKLERAAAKPRAAGADRRAAAKAKADLQPVFDQLAALEEALAPYEQIKTDLAAARSRFRALTAAFTDELKTRCTALTDDEKRALVLELFAQDVQIGLDAAVTEKRQTLVRFVEELWDKYRVTLTDIKNQRLCVEERLKVMLTKLSYS
jgi:type I restriction enzyme M protein